MSLVTISGLPSAGKTTKALELVAYFEECIRLSNTLPANTPVRIVYICDHSLDHSENVPANEDTTEGKERCIKIALNSPRSSYATAKDEKQARGHLLATAQRHLKKDTVVVVDGPNYIKGFRYQLHCEAKNLGLRSCVIHVASRTEDARRRNQARLNSILEGKGLNAKQVAGGSDQHAPYTEEAWEDLTRRYEEPNGMMRWDKPLFTVVQSEEEPEWKDRVWREGVCGERAGSATGASNGDVLTVRPNAAAVAPPPTDPNHLYALDRTTQAILSLIQSHQQQHANEPGGELSFNPTLLSYGSSNNVETSTSESLEPLTVHLPERILPSMQLQRLRRQFIALNRQQMGGMGMGAIGKGGIAASRASASSQEQSGLTAARVAELFVAWLNDSFGSG